MGSFVKHHTTTKYVLSIKCQGGGRDILLGQGDLHKVRQSRLEIQHSAAAINDVNCFLCYVHSFMVTV